jgi:hypothetical protein
VKLWVIRDAQLRAFEEPLRQEFLRRAMQHLRAHFDGCRKMPAKELRALVEDGVAQAAVHGIVTERDVCKLLGMMVVFGTDFTARLDWARGILESDAGPTLKTNRLLARGARESGGPREQRR